MENEFKTIQEFLELSEFLTITEQDLKLNNDFTKVIQERITRLANINDFEDLFLQEMEKRKITPEAVNTFRGVLLAEISIMNEREANKPKDLKNVQLIHIANEFSEWLDNNKNFDFQDDNVSLINQIALIRRAGIIKFLLEQNPKTNPHNIAKLIKKMINSDKNIFTISQYLTQDLENEKHPFRDTIRLKEIDEVLNSFKISHKVDE